MLENELGDGNISLHECVFKNTSNIISWDGYKRDAEEYTHQWNRVPFQMRIQELGHNILKKRILFKSLNCTAVTESKIVGQAVYKLTK
jgi:hypothetical protein